MVALRAQRIDNEKTTRRPPGAQPHGAQRRRERADRTGGERRRTDEPPGEDDRRGEPTGEGSVSHPRLSRCRTLLGSFYPLALAYSSYPSPASAPAGASPASGCRPCPVASLSLR